MGQTMGRVLVVEDQELWREQFFGEALQELGFTVYPASTKDEALELLKKYEFDLAILDINLTAVTGNTDGLVVADYLESVGAKTPIILVSGTDGGFQALHARRDQIFAKIPKDSFNFDDFISQVKLAVARH